MSISDDFDRTQEEDHDLLTFGEAGLRMNEELAALQAQRAAMDPDSPEAAAVDQRIQLLESARSRINTASGRDFFNYDPRR